MLFLSFLSSDGVITLTWSLPSAKHWDYLQYLWQSFDDCYLLNIAISTRTIDSSKYCFWNSGLMFILPTMLNYANLNHVFNTVLCPPGTKVLRHPGVCLVGIVQCRHVFSVFSIRHYINYGDELVQSWKSGSFTNDGSQARLNSIWVDGFCHPCLDYIDCHQTLILAGKCHVSHFHQH